MLGLSSFAHGYPAGPEARGAASDVNWRTGGFDLEAEIGNLRAAVDTSQRGLNQIEGKLAGRLEQICQRHVSDALASLQPIQELQKSVSKLQSENRHVGLEVQRLPTARDVDSALEKHRGAIDSRVGERLEALERSLASQHQSSLERLESRGGETWRVCLQKMTTLEERAVMNSDLPRVVEKIFSEVRRAGPELLGAGAQVPQAMAQMQKVLRQLEAKVAGCDARLLGLSEDSSADNRVWRASCASRVEALERSQCDLGSRLVCCEASQVASEESSRRLVEVAERSAREARQEVDAVNLRVQELTDSAVQRIEVSAQARCDGLEKSTRVRSEDLRREIEALQLRLQGQDQSLESGRDDSARAMHECIATKESLAVVRAELAQLSAHASSSAISTRELVEKDMGRRLLEMRHDMQVQVAAVDGTIQSKVAHMRASIESVDRRIVASERSVTELSSGVARAEATTAQALVQLEAAAALRVDVDEVLGRGAASERRVAELATQIEQALATTAVFASEQKTVLAAAAASATAAAAAAMAASAPSGPPAARPSPVAAAALAAAPIPSVAATAHPHLSSAPSSPAQFTAPIPGSTPTPAGTTPASAPTPAHALPAGTRSPSTATTPAVASTPAYGEADRESVASRGTHASSRQTSLPVAAQGDRTSSVGRGTPASSRQHPPSSHASSRHLTAPSTEDAPAAPNSERDAESRSAGRSRVSHGGPVRTQPVDDAMQDLLHNVSGASSPTEEQAGIGAHVPAASMPPSRAATSASRSARGSDQVSSVAAPVLLEGGLTYEGNDEASVAQSYSHPPSEIAHAGGGGSSAAGIVAARQSEPSHTPAGRTASSTGTGAQREPGSVAASYRETDNFASSEATARARVAANLADELGLGDEFGIGDSWDSNEGNDDPAGAGLHVGLPAATTPRPQQGVDPDGTAGASGASGSLARSPGSGRQSRGRPEGSALSPGGPSVGIGGAPVVGESVAGSDLEGNSFDDLPDAGAVRTSRPASTATSGRAPPSQQSGLGGPTGTEELAGGVETGVPPLAESANASAERPDAAVERSGRSLTGGSTAVRSHIGSLGPAGSVAAASHAASAVAASHAGSVVAASPPGSAMGASPAESAAPASQAPSAATASRTPSAVAASHAGSAAAHSHPESAAGASRAGSAVAGSRAGSAVGEVAQDHDPWDESDDGGPGAERDPWDDSDGDGGAPKKQKPKQQKPAAQRGKAARESDPWDESEGSGGGSLKPPEQQAFAGKAGRPAKEKDPWDESEESTGVAPSKQAHLSGKHGKTAKEADPWDDSDGGGGGSSKPAPKQQTTSGKSVKPAKEKDPWNESEESTGAVPSKQPQTSGGRSSKSAPKQQGKSAKPAKEKDPWDESEESFGAAPSRQPQPSAKRTKAESERDPWDESQESVGAVPARQPSKPAPTQQKASGNPGKAAKEPDPWDDSGGSFSGVQQQQQGRAEKERDPWDESEGSVSAVPSKQPKPGEKQKGKAAREPDPWDESDGGGGGSAKQATKQKPVGKPGQAARDADPWDESGSSAAVQPKQPQTGVARGKVATEPDPWDESDGGGGVSSRPVPAQQKPSGKQGTSKPPAEPDPFDSSGGSFGASPKPAQPKATKKPDDSFDDILGDVEAGSDSDGDLGLPDESSPAPAPQPRGAASGAASGSAAPGASPGGYVAGGGQDDNFSDSGGPPVPQVKAKAKAKSAAPAKSAAAMDLGFDSDEAPGSVGSDNSWD